jgi:hypothetical protein
MFSLSLVESRVSRLLFFSLKSPCDSGAYYFFDRLLAFALLLNRQLDRRASGRLAAMLT